LSRPGVTFPVPVSVSVPVQFPVPVSTPIVRLKTEEEKEDNTRSL